jgi:hypothetical protein
MFRDNKPENERVTSKDPEVPSPGDFHRAKTTSPPKSSDSDSDHRGGNGAHSRSSSLSGKRTFDVDPIRTPPSGNAKKNSPEASPDGDGDPEIQALIANAKPPFSEYLHIEKFLREINENPPPPQNYQLISAVKRRQKESLEQYIKGLDIDDLKFLSLYMNSIQVGNSTDYYFKTIRTECGGFGWFQSYGNTKTWQHIRSAVKDQIAENLQRSEIRGKKKHLPELLYEVYLQIFQQHSGRFPWGQTRSERQFTENYTLDTAAPVRSIRVK